MAAIRTAIIGVSGFGRVHYADLLSGVERGTLSAKAACIINQDEEADKCTRLRELGCTIYDDFQALLDAEATELDLVQIPTGIPLHRPMTEAAVAAGCNVLVEKPVAGSAADAHAMQAARNASGKLVAVGFQRMYDPAVWALKRRLLDGSIGRIERITGSGLWPRARAYYDRNAWAGCLRSGDHQVLDSPINNAMAHYVMLMLFFAGSDVASPATVADVRSELYRANEIESPDTMWVGATSPEGVAFSFAASHCCMRNEGPTIRIQGSAGVAEWHWGGDEDCGWLATDAGHVEHFTGLRGDALRAGLIDKVAAAIRGESVEYCDLDIAVAHTELVDALHAASPTVTDLPPDSYIIGQDGDSPLRIINSITGIMQAHLTTGLSFSQQGCNWS